MGWSTRADVVAKLRKRWDTGEFLTTFATGQVWSPLDVALRAPKSRDLAADYDAVREWARVWRGVTDLRVESLAVGGRLIGENELPCRVWIDSYDQLWSLLGVGREVRRFTGLVEWTNVVAPALVEWMLRRPHGVLAFDDDTWRKIVETVVWISTRADSGMYLRQVDVPGVDTKFIETHRRILGTLLDLLLEPGRVDPTWSVSDFAARYRFRRKPQYVRYRWLDTARSTGGFSEVEVRVEELAETEMPASTVFVIENDITYLAFPSVQNAIAIFGGGYSLTRLRRLDWLHDRNLVYWGDLDTHGFAMLDMLRKDFPHARSILMDRATLLAHETQWVREEKPLNVALTRLLPAESHLYRDLVEDVFGGAVRLEQERVRYSEIESALADHLDVAT